MMTSAQYEAEIDRMGQEIQRLNREILNRLSTIESLVRAQPLDLRESIAKELDAYGAPQAARQVRAGGSRG